MSVRSAFTGAGVPSYSIQPNATSAENGLPLVYNSTTNELGFSGAGTVYTGTLTFTEDGGAGTFPATNYVATKTPIGAATALITIMVSLVDSSVNLTGGGFPLVAALPAELAPDVEAVAGCTSVVSAGTVIGYMVTTDFAPSPSLFLQEMDATLAPGAAAATIRGFSCTYIGPA